MATIEEIKDNFAQLEEWDDATATSSSWADRSRRWRRRSARRRTRCRAAPASLAGEERGAQRARRAGLNFVGDSDAHIDAD